MKNVSFYLGPAEGLTSRRLVITRMHRAGDDTPPAAEVDVTLDGSAETTTHQLPDNQIWQAVLIDTRTGGESSVRDILNFHTGDLQFPGPRSGDRLQVLSMEDLSSSSSSSSWSSGSTSSSSISASSSSISASSSSQSSSSISTSSSSSSTSSSSSSSSSSSVSSSSVSSSSWSSQS